MVKDLDEKRALIHEKDQEEEKMLDKIEILNATVESYKERSKSNTDHHQRDSHELNQQLLNMKKMLLETESDVQVRILI